MRTLYCKGTHAQPTVIRFPRRHHQELRSRRLVVARGHSLIGLTGTALEELVRLWYSVYGIPSAPRPRATGSLLARSRVAGARLGGVAALFERAHGLLVLPLLHPDRRTLQRIIKTPALATRWPHEDVVGASEVRYLAG